MTTSGYKVYKDRSAPAVDAQWLNEVSTVVYSLLGSGAPQYLPPTSRAELLAYLGIAANTMNVQITTTVATAGQTAFTAPIYVPGINNLSVYVDGIRKNLQSGDYTETSSTVFTLTVPATAGAKVVAVVLAANAIGTTDAGSVTANDGASGTLFTTVAGFISRLMSTVGAALVGFKQSGTGAVNRNVSLELADWVKVSQFGGLPSASASTNSAAFAATVTYAISTGMGVRIPAGSYTLDAPFRLTAGGLRVMPEGKVILNFTHSGNCVEVDGGATGTYIFDVHFGDESNPIWINGNSGTTTALYWRAAHHGSASIKAWNCVIGHRTQFAVCNTFWVTVSNSEAVSNTLVPTAGISCERRTVGEDTAANTWENPVIEGIKTSTGHGIYLGNTNRNKFNGGTSEGNVLGVYATSSAVGDTINGLYCEVNTGAAHFDISGSLITLIDCFSATATPAPAAWVRFRTGATDCRVIGGNHPAITVDTGALRTVILGNSHSAGSSVIDNGTDTTVIQGGAAAKLPFGSFLGSGPTALAYYGEGTLTATITCDSGTITLNSSYQTLNWVRVGRMVTVTGLLIVSSVSSPTGNCMIGNLPFSTDSATASRAAVSIRVDGLSTAATTAIQGRVLSPDNKIYLEQYAAGVATGLAPRVQAGSEFYISLTYIAAS